MSSKNILTTLKRYHQRLNGGTIEYNLTFYKNTLYEIDKYKSDYENKHDNQLKTISQTLLKRAQNNETLDNLLVEAFALVREAIWRVLNIHPFDVQIIGGIVMHQCKLVEMQTGEGKTLTAVFPAFLHGLSGKGVHILTFNDYLARRDAQWMGPVYEFLGLTVGYIQEGMKIEERQKGYNADITYLTAKESGFDFLRDGLCYNQVNIVHRDFHFAIIDEADSILIDEARVPLIIAGASDEFVAEPYIMAQISRQLDENIDFGFDEYSRNIHLTDHGIKRVEALINCTNLHNNENIHLLTRLNCALHAEYLLHRDIDYIVRNSKVELIDEYTGRIADKRRWPDGLQAAIEAKENLTVQTKGQILNSITLQHFVQLYPRISGMTATAQAAEKEFREFYNLHIVVIPPNKPCIRKDHQDIVYRTKEAKNKALINEIIRAHKTKRPVLVGTRSVDESAVLAAALQKQSIKCDVLNAKRDEFEAKIIARAGKLSAVTISTNMAGRGTDIQLGAGDKNEKDEVTALNGLYVIGTNKHESRRIDNQLRGRSGRQGDPGLSCFFISLEDDLFIKYRLQDLLHFHSASDLQENKINNPIIKTELDHIQRIIEGQNLEIKKTLCKYSSLIEQQRKIVFDKRKKILQGNSILDFFRSNSPDQFNSLIRMTGEKKLFNGCKYISLYYLDKFWSQYLAEIADIREGIHLMRLGGEDPFLEFQKLTIEIFDKFQRKIKFETINSFNDIQITNNVIDLNKSGLKTPSSTWTYLINDNPFEHMMGIQLMGNRGLQIGAGIWGPLLAVYYFWKKFCRKGKKGSISN